MAYIRGQRPIKDKDGYYTAGSASIEESVYVKPGEKDYHSRHVSKESLGRVVWLSDDKKSGIFLSPTRGLVEYDSVSGQFTTVGRDDSRLPPGRVFPDPPVHTVFGDAYLLAEFLHGRGMAGVFAKAFPDETERERFLCHIFHGVLKDGSRVHCGDFIVKSILSRVLNNVPPGSLDSDSAFFTTMGDDRVKVRFFKSFVGFMRKEDKEFGRCCFIDSTPLPNDISDNPYNALSSHGVEATSVQTRLAIVQDKKTGVPVWYMVIPGNLHDFSTLRSALEDVEECLDIRITDLVLDAGYVTYDLLAAREEGAFDSMIARMPAKNGFPYHELYAEFRPMFHEGEFKFTYSGHVYFGHRKEVAIGGHHLHAYVYVDFLNSTLLRAKWESEHIDEFDGMTPEEKNWLDVKYGFFVLITEKEDTPKQVLTEYFERTGIEVMNKTSKEFAELLPLCKWTLDRVLGKILYELIVTIVLVLLRKEIRKRNDKKNVHSTTYIFGKTQSLMCLAKEDGTISVETANKDARRCYELLGLKVPGSVPVAEFRDKVLHVGSALEQKAPAGEGNKAMKKSGGKKVGQGKKAAAAKKADDNNGSVPSNAVATAADTSSQPTGGAAGKRGRGRPKGSKDKQPRKKRGTNQAKKTNGGEGVETPAQGAV